MFLDLCKAVLVQTKVTHFIHPYTPLYTPIHSYTPLYTPIHPYTPLYTPIHPYTPLYTPIHPYTPLYTPVHPIQVLMQCDYVTALPSSPLWTTVGLMLMDENPASLRAGDVERAYMEESDKDLCRYGR